MHLHENSHTNAHSSFIHNSPKWKQPTRHQVMKQDVDLAYDGIFLIINNEVLTLATQRGQSLKNLL